MKTCQRFLYLMLVGLLMLGLASPKFALTRAPVVAAQPKIAPYPIVAPQAATATLAVTSLADTTANDGYCTLREAIINANNNAATWPDCAAGSGADVIDLTGLNGQITLLSNLPELTDPAGLAVQGPGVATLAISGNDAYRMFRVFQDNPPIDGPLTVRDLTLRNAKGDNPGSVIRTPSGSAVEVWNSVIVSNTHTAISVSGGSLTVAHSRLNGNTGNSGAAINAVNAPTVVDDSEFMFNQASGSGHAIFQGGGSLTLNRSRFQQNGVSPTETHGTVEYSGDMDIIVTDCDFVDNQTRQGGALHDAGGAGVVRIANSRFNGNVASYGAGVIRSGGGRILDISHSVFVGNSATSEGGVINSFAAMTITASAFYSNTANLGGVIFTPNDATGPITILDSLFQGNHANHSGGAIWFGRGLYVTNSTFYTNTAAYGGGALASLEGWGEINNSTFDHNGGNNGAALYFGMGWAPPITLRNTIVANPLWGNNCYAYTGAYTDGGYNLQYPGTSCNAAIPEVNPLLDPAGPQDNGGPTASIALQAGSPAIDRAPAGGGFYCPATDQRGAPRPVDGDGGGAADCDSGAFEYDSVGPVTLSKTAVDANGAPLLPGDTISYTLRVENTFPATVSGVVLTDTIPPYTTYVADSDAPAADAEANPLVWSGLSLTAKAVQIFTFAVTVNANAGGQVIENVACSAQPGLSATCTPPVTPPGPDGGTVTPMLQLAKIALDVNGGALLPGDVIRYTIQVTNAHAVTVTGVTLRDAIPAYTTYVADSDTPEADADADPLVWSAQSIPPGSKTYTFEATVNANAGGQTIANTACLAQPGRPQTCTDPATPPGAGGGTVLPVLLFGKTALDVNGDLLEEGDLIRYTLTVTNPHDVVVAGVVISDAIPAHTTYVADSDTPDADADANPLVWSNHEIPAGVQTFTFEVQVNAQAGGNTIQNSAYLTQPGLPQTATPPGVDGGLVQPPLQFQKYALDVNGGDLLPGDLIRYTLIVTNPRAIAVESVVISDAIPAHTTYVAASDMPEADTDTDPLVWSGQSIAAGAARTYQFDVRVEATAGGQTIANTACLAQPGRPQTCTDPATPPGTGGGTVLPVLLFGKTALDVNGGLLEEGDLIRYTLTVTNPHSVVVAGAVISDVIPAHTTYVADSDTPEADADGNPLVWSGQSFESGALAPVVKTYSFTVTVNAGALGQFIRNTGYLTQPGRPQISTPPVEPPNGGQVKTQLYLPLVVNQYPAP